MKVVLCTPTIKRPFNEFIAAVERSVPALDAAGIDHSICFEVGSAYISWARANMLQKAMKADADAAVFLDHDLSWNPDDLVRLIQHPGDVVAGTYRYKYDNEEYMGTFEVDEAQRPIVRDDGTIKARAVPAGFLKVTRAAVDRLAAAHPELKFGPDMDFVDLFHHGAFHGTWWGEDYAFSRRWCFMGEEIYLIPDLNVAHHLDGKAFPGNLHEFLTRQPGGSNEPQAKPEFSKRQADVLGLMKFGKPNKIIAYELGIEESSVKTHIRAIMKKLKATNRTEAVYRFAQLGLEGR